jgi:hypothetical protein
VAETPDLIDNIVSTTADAVDHETNVLTPSEACEVFERLAVHFSAMADGMRVDHA